ncbi:hypothetical protein [Pseudomonas sp. LB3P31]
MGSLTLVVAGTFVMTTQISSAIWLIVSAHKLTEQAESHLKTSKLVEINLKTFGSFGLFGKIPRNGSIIVMFLAPDLFERRGLIDARELSTMPTSLRNKLILPWIVSIISSLAFFFVPIYGQNI